MRISEMNKFYFPAEETESNHYVFDKILNTVPKGIEYEKINKKTKYLI